MDHSRNIPSAAEPLIEYKSRRNRLKSEEAILDKRFIAIGNWRLAGGVAAAVIAYFAFGRQLLSGWWLVLPIGLIVGLAAWLGRLNRGRTLARRGLAYYDRAIARVEDQWAAGTGASGDMYRENDHVYAGDLDLFGKGSLFELINAARTSAGEKTLADWLLAPASPQEAAARQDAVKELCLRLELREDMALLGDDIRAELNREKLTAWGAAPAIRFPRGARVVAFLLAVLSTAALIGMFAGAVPPWSFVLILAVEFGFTFYLRSRVIAVIDAVESSGRDLSLFSELVSRLEKESFESVKLRELRGRLDVLGTPASKRIARLQRWIDWLDSSDHLLVRAIRPVVLWREQIAMGLEAWRQRIGASVGPWLDALAQFEAFSSVGALTYERPLWVFPNLIDSADPQFEATDLRHPLIPRSRCVPNDLAIGGALRLLIVSGSNMSGKSTLLRSIGLNTVLAWAGAPVSASRMSISPVQPAASMRIVDSLQDNKSRFFAEISRLRQIVDLSKGATPVLFLLDELLSGTNSHDRRIGAAAVVKGLVRAGAIGLVTTHDLALANIQQDLGEQAANVHFDDRIEDGRMEFDYRMRPGVVTHSNALELMRAVGLDV